MGAWADVAAARRAKRVGRRRGGRLRLLALGAGSVVATGCGAGIAVGALDDVAGVLEPVGAVTPTLAPEPAPIEGLLDLEPGTDVVGLTRPAPPARAGLTPPREDPAIPGLERRQPVQIDWVQSWRDARERHENTQWLEAHRGQRDAEWARRRGLLCEGEPPPSLAHLCDTD